MNVQYNGKIFSASSLMDCLKLCAKYDNFNNVMDWFNYLGQDDGDGKFVYDTIQDWISFVLRNKIVKII